MTAGNMFRCLMCGYSPMIERRGDYVWNAQQDPVTLVGMRWFECSNCGEDEVEIPHIDDLEEAIRKHRAGRGAVSLRMQFLGEKWVHDSNLLESKSSD